MSIAASVSENPARKARVPRLPRIRRDPANNAQHNALVSNAEVSKVVAGSSSNLAPGQSPTPPTRVVWSDYLHEEFLVASTSAPDLGVLPAIEDSYDEDETMGATMSSQASFGQAERAPETSNHTEAELSFGSSGTTDSGPELFYNIVQGECMEELY